MKKASTFQDLESHIRKIRKEYHFGTLRRKDLQKNPWDQFASWFLQAVKKSASANVMVLATAAKGSVSTRCVLLKGFDEQGLLFHSNANSRKAAQIKANPRVSACFYWPELEKQVTVIGKAVQVPLSETKKYFMSRPRESQIAAWCSFQNKVLKNREALDGKFEKMKKKFEGGKIPIPPYWTGYRIKPEEFEFWQGRANRLNDRFRYRRAKGAWRIDRIEP